MKVDLTLYLVTDSTGLSDDEFLKKIDLACAGGVTLVQLREKERGGREYLELARKVKRVTDAHGIPLIIDDRVDVAMACGAAGAHVGRSDLPVSEARRLLGDGKVVGATAKTVEQALAAQADGADYLGVGAIYPTTTKVKTVLTSVDTLNEICAAVDIGVVAIGGLNAGNCEALSRSPVCGIAAVSAIMKADDAELAARELRDKVISMRAWHEKKR